MNNNYHRDFLKNISRYCRGDMIMGKEEERRFLMNPAIKEITGNKSTLNSGKLSEWYFSQILKDKNITFIEQPRVDYTSFGKRRYIKPDFYIPSEDLFVEIKSRSYNCPGTASEKIDNIPRKYSSKRLPKKYTNSKVLIVFSAGELVQDSTMEILQYGESDAQPYIKEFVKLSKNYRILDWVDINDVDKYI